MPWKIARLMSFASAALLGATASLNCESGLLNLRTVSAFSSGESYFQSSPATTPHSQRFVALAICSSGANIDRRY